jgi:hypothetical protein
MPKDNSGFEYGAKVLKISVDALVDIYKDTIGILHEGISVAKASPPIGLMALIGYFDLLHGGAYAAPINALPHYAPVMDKSPYYAGDIRNKPIETWLSWLAQNTAGTNATDMMVEVLEDANVPHVFPKLLSDPMYAQLKLAFAQAMSMDFFKTGTTSLSTLVEGAGKGVGSAGRGLGALKGEEEPQFTGTQARALLALLGKKG